MCNAHYLRKRTFEASNHGVAWDPRIVVKPGRPRTPYNAETVRKGLAGVAGGWNPKLSKERVFAARDFGPVPSTLPHVASQSRYGKGLSKGYCNIRQAKNDRAEAGRLSDHLGAKAYSTSTH